MGKQKKKILAARFSKLTVIQAPWDNGTPHMALGYRMEKKCPLNNQMLKLFTKKEQRKKI